MVMPGVVEESTAEMPVAVACPVFTRRSSTVKLSPGSTFPLPLPSVRVVRSCSRAGIGVRLKLAVVVWFCVMTTFDCVCDA